MSGNSEAIVKTFRQILDIYKQIKMLLETSKELMEARGWVVEANKRHPEWREDYYYGTSHGFLQSIVRIPSYLQQRFGSASEPTQIKESLIKSPQ